MINLLTHRRESMNLQEFVTEGITQIVRGVIKAQETLRDTNSLVNPCMKLTGKEHTIGVAEGYAGQPVTNVEFDVAVSVSEETGTKGGIGIIVGAIGIGTQGRSDTSSGTLSRIRFNVPLLLSPHKKK